MNTLETARATPPTDPARRTYSLVALCLAFFVVQLDATVVTVALGAIRDDVGGTVTAQQWVVDAYTLVLAAGMLGAGWSGDRFGSRRVCLLGLALFGVASVACAVAPTGGALIAARAVQGAGAAALLPCSLALIIAQFPEPGPRARALGLWGGIGSLGLAAGPVLGGVLVAGMGWRAVFLLNVPVCLVAVPLIRRYVRDGGPRDVAGLDLAGFVLGTAALAGLTGGLVAIGQPGHRAAEVLIGAGCLLGALFVLVERRVPAPMLPIGLFGRPRFGAATAAGFLFNFGLYGVLFCVSLVLQAVPGMTTVRVGLLILPLTVAVGVGATGGGRLTARYGPRAPMLTGYALGALGVSVVAVGGMLGSLPLLVAGAAVLGLCSIAMPAMTSATMAAADATRPGLASGVLNTARQTGGALGVAVLGSLLGASGSPGAGMSGAGMSGAGLVAPMAVALAGYLVALGATVRATRSGPG